MAGQIVEMDDPLPLKLAKLFIHTELYTKSLRLNPEQYENLRRFLVTDAARDNEDRVSDLVHGEDGLDIADYWERTRNRIRKVLNTWGGIRRNNGRTYEDIAIVVTMLNLMHGCFKTFAECALGRATEYSEVRLRDVNIISQLISRFLPALTEGDTVKRFRSCETQCFTEAGVQGIAAFVDITLIQVIDNSKPDNEEDEVDLRISRFGENYVKLIIFSDLEQRVISHDVFPGSELDEDCLRNSRFFKKYLVTDASHLGAFQCRNCPGGGGHFITGTLVAKPSFAGQDGKPIHPCIIHSAPFVRIQKNTYVKAPQVHHDLTVILANLVYNQERLVGELKNRCLILKTSLLYYSHTESAIGAGITIHNGLKMHQFNNDPDNCIDPECGCKFVTPTTNYRPRMVANTDPVALPLIVSYHQCTPYSDGDIASIKVRNRDLIRMPLANSRVKLRGEEENEDWELDEGGIVENVDYMEEGDETPPRPELGEPVPEPEVEGKRRRLE